MTAIRPAIRSAIQPAIRSAFGAAIWDPLTLFAASEQGVWYDPSDLSTMFQDSAGTTPVTAIGDPVGKILDKSGNGKHASQSTAASRPVLGRTPVGGKRNLLVNTDTLSTQNYTTTAVAHTLSFTGTGTVTLSGTSTAGPLVGTGVSDRVSLTFTPTAGALTLTVSGSVTLAQLELGSSATAYQKVVQAYDCTESGKADCYCLYFDGVDDSLATAAIDFTATDEMSLFAGLWKNKDTTGLVAEISANMNANAGAFYFNVNDGIWDWASKSRGAAAESGYQIAYVTEAGPAVAVLSTTHDISGDLTTLRKNGVAATNSTADKGAGNFGNYPLYIGRRAGTSFPLSGNIYSLTVLGRTATAAEITAAEAYVAGKTGLSI